MLPTICLSRGHQVLIGLCTKLNVLETLITKPQQELTRLLGHQQFKSSLEHYLERQ